MSEAALAIVLTAALLHASWNAVLKKGTDRFRTMTIMKIATVALAVPVVFLVPMPAAAAWLPILLSAAIHVAYNLTLLRAYAHGDLGQVYPIARGSSPLLVTLGAAAGSGRVAAANSAGRYRACLVWNFEAGRRLVTQRVYGGNSSGDPDRCFDCRLHGRRWARRQSVRQYDFLCGVAFPTRGNTDPDHFIGERAPKRPAFFG